LSFLPVAEYLGGLAFFGFCYWLLDGIQEEFHSVSQTGDVYDLALFVWIGIVFLYIIFGGIWLVRKYSHERERGGY